LNSSQLGIVSSGAESEWIESFALRNLCLQSWNWDANKFEISKDCPWTWNAYSVGWIIVSLTSQNLYNLIRRYINDRGTSKMPLTFLCSAIRKIP
jgi:hypothetical protein